MDLSEEIYRGGFYALLRDFEKSHRPYATPLAYLPPVDCDLDSVLEDVVRAPDVSADALVRGTIECKDAEFREEFSGQSQMLYVHAMLVANLRRKAPPADILTLYQRIWAEKGSWLARNLNVRWRISAATTFADCGVTMEQRALGMGLSVLFDTIKLHDSERRRSGHAGDMPFARTAGNSKRALAFDMQPYAIKKGDLDRNMLARLWSLAESDKVIYPLARAMLFDVMMDKRSIFARLQKLKDDERGD